ncbi:MAG: site-specific integrase [Rikenellaceae bacterium]
MEKKRYSTFAVMFYINKGKAKKSGLCTIMGRISVSGEVAQFSTKIDIAPAQWDAKSYRLKGKGREVIEVNRKIEELIETISNNHKELVEQKSYVTAELLKNRLFGIGKRQDMLLASFAEYNAEYEKMVGVSRAKNSYQKYTSSYRHLSEFVATTYGVDDILISSVDDKFVSAYNFYLKGTKGFKPNTINIYTHPFRKVITRAINQGVIRKDPFDSYTFAKKVKRYRHMSSEDLHKLMTTSLKSRSLGFIRDMFVFSTFTGICYADMKNLSLSNLHTNGDYQWITLQRQKTNSDCYIPLLEIPQRIIAKYEPLRKSDKVFNMISLANMNRDLKKIAKLCGIEKTFSYHDSRHNFGTLITLLNGVPLETVSKMMGHDDLQTTEIYAHLTNQKINDDMRPIVKSAKRKYKLFEDKGMPITTKYNYFEYRQRYEKKYCNN